jgi:hypothetical protein
VQGKWNIIRRLQQENQKAYYLACLRILLCMWWLKEILSRWPALEMLYSNHSFINIPPASWLYLFRINPYLIREHYMLLVAVCITLLLLNIFGIGRHVVALLLFLCLRLLHGINDKYTNSGDEMALLLAFYLIFANSFSHFTYSAQKRFPEAKQKVYNLLSNLAAYSIMANLCLIYFSAGLAKLDDSYWLNGTAMYYFLNDERHSILAAGGHVAVPAILVYILTYGTLLFELSFPLFVWRRLPRNIFLIVGVIMHLGIYIFLMIYGMSIVFIIQYGLFFSNGEVLSFAQKCRSSIKKLLPRFAVG